LTESRPKVMFSTINKDIFCQRITILGLVSSFLANIYYFETDFSS
jgi:hypothetical protein